MSPRLVEAFTSSHIIWGCYTAMGGSSRLVDLLNQDSHLLVLADCKARPLRQSGDLVALGTTCFIPKNQIVWARPLESASSEEAERHITEHDYIDKKLHPVVVLAPPFHITGNAHVPVAADITLALAQLASRFLPLTEARTVIEGDEEYAWDTQVLVLNGSRADVIQLGPADQPSG